MSSEERRKILQMVEEGKISAEQAASLMRALESDSDGAQIDVIEPEPALHSHSGPSSFAEFEEVKRRARNLALIPLWTGIVIAVLSAWGMFAIQQNFGMNFWFYLLLFPLLLGVLLIAISSSGPGSRWLYVNVNRRYAHDGPRNITLGFPLPLGLTSWFLRTFGHYIHGMKHTNVDDILQLLNATGKSGEPFIVNVSNDDDGERVQVYIG